MGKLTFSVGIPTFNQADFLEETILSLLNQTRPPDEIVISDHYSTDHTPDIIRKYSKHIRGVQPPPGVKLAGQYNFTLMSQNCDWVTTFCSDDIALPNYAEVLMRGAERNPDAALIRAGWQLMDNSGAIIGKEGLLTMPKVQSPPDTLLTQRNGPRVCGTSYAIRREAFLRAGPILESLHSLVDWALYLQLAPFGAFIREPEIIATYRVGHDGNKLRSRFKMWAEDQERIFYEIMPKSAEQAGLSDRSWIDEASRAKFFEVLAVASNEFAPEERVDVVSLLQPWAVRVGSVNRLQEFAEGKQISVPVSLTERGKRMIRPVIQSLYARLHS
jgi:GT2 family glycosyltransferase